MSDIRVLLVDDDQLVRSALAALLEREAGIDVVATAVDPAGAALEASVSHPDVAVVDVKMPGGGGPRAAANIAASSPGTKILALSAFDDRRTVLQMVRAGAIGYLVKGDSPTKIVDAIREVGRGRGSLSGTIAKHLVEELAGKLEREEAEQGLSHAQRQRVEAALEEGAIKPLFQPIVDIASGETVGVEALARFAVEPDRSPDIWFAEAEAVGATVQLEMAAFHAAVHAAREIPSGLFVSLNLSPNTLVNGCIEDIQLAAAFRPLVIEITEHAPVSDYEAVAKATKALREQGGRLAVDDAGAGFSSLRHILRLDPDLIKLDVSLTRGVHRDPKKRALAAAFTSFAREVGSEIVVEGLETEAERAAMEVLGARYGQGFLWSRAVPAGSLPRTFATTAGRS